MLTTLKQNLENWTDFDVASHQLAICLGLMPPDISFSKKAKHVYWTDNPVGDTLYQTLRALIAIGVLEENEDKQMRWNPAFKGSWEAQS